MIEVLSDRYMGLQPDKEAFEKYMADLAVKLDVFEKILSKQKYVAGDVCVFSNDYGEHEYAFMHLFLFLL